MSTAELTDVGITINGKDVLVAGGCTILEACRTNGITVPTLCYDDHLKPLGGCWMCVVEVEGRGLVPSCDTRVWPGMVVHSESEAVIAARKKRVEELLAAHYGDCTAPCRLACPAGVDIQGYLALIARGQYREAVASSKSPSPCQRSSAAYAPTPARRHAAATWWTSRWLSAA